MPSSHNQQLQDTVYKFVKHCSYFFHKGYYFKPGCSLMVQGTTWSRLGRLESIFSSFGSKGLDYHAKHYGVCLKFRNKSKISPKMADFWL